MISEAAFDSEYVIGWLLGPAILIISGIVAGLLSVAVVGVFIGFYAFGAAFYCYGRAYAAARENR